MGIDLATRCLKDVLSSKHESFGKGQLASSRMKDLFGKHTYPVASDDLTALDSQETGSYSQLTQHLTL